MKKFFRNIALYTLAVLSLGSALMSASYADAAPVEKPAAVSAAAETVCILPPALPASNQESQRSLRSVSLMNIVTYALKANAFLKDSRWKNGISWNGSRKPKLSKWRCSGCMAYAVDFCKYVYGEDWASSPKKFKKITNVNDLTTGDAVRINGHYFIIVQRKGNKLYTAEGNYSSKVRASLTTYGYYIQGNRLYQNWYNAKGTSTGKKEVTFVCGYRHK